MERKGRCGRIARVPSGSIEAEGERFERSREPEEKRAVVRKWQREGTASRRQRTPRVDVERRRRCGKRCTRARDLHARTRRRRDTRPACPPLQLDHPHVRHATKLLRPPAAEFLARQNSLFVYSTYSPLKPSPTPPRAHTSPLLLPTHAQAPP